MRKDRGSATVWSLGLMGVLLALFAAVLLMDQAVVARHRAGAAADLAALAAADHALDGEPAACGFATRVASAQGAAVVGCTVTGEIADVIARVGPAQARSRAGPPGPAGSPGSPALPGAAVPSRSPGPPSPTVQLGPVVPSATPDPLTG